MPVNPPSTLTWWSVGLTPAQSWISEARRSRDLLVGSRLLAWTMGRLLAQLKSRGATVQLPKVEEKDLATLSGPFLAALKSGSTAITNHASGFLAMTLDEAQPLFAELDGCLAGFWEELHQDLATTTGRSAGELWELVAPALGRPRCPLQVVWALKAGPSDDGAGRGLDEVEVLYAAVKRSRPIGEHAEPGPVRKCEQCGRREAMGGPDPAKWRQFQADLAKLPEVKQGLRFEAGEYLCPVCAFRRLAGYLQDEAFPSTSDIATSHWLWRIRNSPDLRAALASLTDRMKRVPGHDKDWADRAPLYYPRSIDRERRRAGEEDDERAAGSLDDVEAALRHLASEIREHNRRLKKDEAPIPEKPPEYLAVLMFDGDDFGERLRKDLDTLPSRVAEFQDRLVAHFAKRDEDRPPWGRPFYLGGDEGLVLAPLVVTLDLAHSIQEIWNQTAGSTAAKATMSMGIALFDRERPLGAAIETARRSLDQAKRMRRPRKNALAVSVQTASGNEWTAVAHWGESWHRIAAAVDLIREGTLAAGWPHDVERFLRSLSREAFRGDEDSRRAIREEVKRITRRRTLRTVGECDPWQRLQGDNWWEKQPAEEELDALADSLHLVAFLSRQSGPLPAASGESEAA